MYNAHIFVTRIITNPPQSKQLCTKKRFKSPFFRQYKPQKLWTQNNQRNMLGLNVGDKNPPTCPSSPYPPTPPLPSLEILFLILGPPWPSDRKKGQSMTTSRQKRRGGKVMCDTLSVSLVLEHWSFKCESNFFILMQIVKIMWTCPLLYKQQFP